jgi:phage shock protein C
VNIMTRTTDAMRHADWYRNPTEGWVAGVCAGLADRFAVSTGVIRLAFVVLALGGTPVLAAILYALLAFVMPVRPLLDAEPWVRRYDRRY